MMMVVDGSPPVFEAPMDGMDVKIWAGYASSHTTVKISKDFVLKGERGQMRTRTARHVSCYCRRGC